MKGIKNLFAHPHFRIFQNPTFLFILWMGITLVCCVFKLAQGKYNNYLIFRQSFWDALAQISLYFENINAYLYGISFTVIIAPFAVLPISVGMILWCLANTAILYYAIRKLEPEKWKFTLIIWVSANDLYEAMVYQQYNVGIAAMIILAFVCIEKKKEFWAAMFIVIGTLTKVYGILGLAFILFSKRKLHLLWGMLFWGIIFFCLPMIYTSPEYVLSQYREWLEVLIYKDNLNTFCYYTNISLLGMVRKISHVDTYSDLWLIIPGIILFITPYFRINQYDSKSFKLLYLSSTLLFMILFSTGTEGCGYISAMVAVGIWFVSTPTRKKTPMLNLILLIFCIVLTSLSASGMFPKYLRVTYVSPYALKALPCVLIWLKIVWEQLTQNFVTASPIPLKQSERGSYIDIILPCYNPYEGWEQQLIEKHEELKGMLGERDIRFIVVNDGSKRGFTADAVLNLTTALPNTIIVDNKINQGKGAAVRDGIANSDSKLALYTDYDFPYKIDSVCQVISNLEAGYDVVVANRNHTYYSQLSTRRKLASHASRFLNFILLGLTHTDTQGGLKGFNRKGKAFLAATQTKQFLFDTEFIYKASLDNSTFIKEVPVDLRSKIMLPDMRRGVFMNELKNLLMICWKG